MALKHPTSTDGITVDYINQLLATAGTGATVTDMRIIDAKTYGEQMVSTAGRVAIEVDYSDDTAPDLPNRLVLKLTRAVDEIMAPFYANEVAFYRGIRPELAIEAPRCFGGDFNASTTHFGLLLEDLGARGATSPTRPCGPGRTMCGPCWISWPGCTRASGSRPASARILPGSKPMWKAR